jgi:GT2 family glycosyltransferase
MSLRVLSPNEQLGASRGDVVVCIPVYEARSVFEQCLRSIAAHSPPGTWVLVADDASEDRGIEAFTRRVAGEPDTGVELAYVRQPVNVGFVRNVNAAFASAAPADVVIVNSDVVVPAGWLDRLRAAAGSDGRVATVSTLTNNGTILSVPDRDAPSPDPPAGRSLAEAAEAVAAASPRLHPQIPTGVGHCLYVRRPALELVGGFDEAFSPGYGEEVDFSMRCLARGLIHVVADDLYVFHRGGASFTTGDARKLQHEHMINHRYPFYAAAIREAATSETIPLAHSLAAAAGALRPLKVTIDGSSLGMELTGTQVHTLELIGALVRHGGVRVRVRIPRAISPVAQAALQGLAIETCFTHDEDEDLPLDDVVHRPFQAVTPLDLQQLRRLGRRVVLTQQDLIAYRNPSYFESFPQWHGYRELTRQALAAADRVTFFSRHAAEEAQRESLVDERRSDVVHIGVDHRLLGGQATPRAPAVPGLADAPFLLCIGTDFLHKNRPFALDVFAALRADHGFPGRLVLVGPSASAGTSRAAEAAWRAQHPDEAASVVDLGAVDEPEKSWLYGHAALMLYPTIQEGFGLVPFEAADAGLATLWAAHTSLAEILPADAAGIVPWNVAATAARAAQLLADPGERRRLVAAVREAGTRFSWDRTAVEMVDVYRRASAALPRVPVAAAEVFADDALALVGPKGYLSDEAQRALLAVVSRPQLRIPFLALLRSGYRALYRARRGALRAG